MNQIMKQIDELQKKAGELLVRKTLKLAKIKLSQAAEREDWAVTYEQGSDFPKADRCRNAAKALIVEVEAMVAQAELGRDLVAAAIRQDCLRSEDQAAARTFLSGASALIANFQKKNLHSVPASEALADLERIETEVIHAIRRIKAVA